MLLEQVKCTPWTDAGRLATQAVTLRRKYITAAQIKARGPTADCCGCSGDSLVRTAACRGRFQAIWK